VYFAIMLLQRTKKGAKTISCLARGEETANKKGAKRSKVVLVCCQLHARKGKRKYAELCFEFGPLFVCAALDRK
jgi:hypothetical protein